DETFCRVVNESMMNGIPVLTTQAGNIRYLVGKSTPIMTRDGTDDWSKQIRELINNPIKYKMMSFEMRKRYEFCSEEIAKKQFEAVILKASIKSKSNSI